MSSHSERTTYTPNYGKIEIPKTDWTETIIAALGDRYLIAEHNLPSNTDGQHYVGERNYKFGLYLDNYGQIWKIYLEDGIYPENKKRILSLNRSDCPLTDYWIDIAKKSWIGMLIPHGYSAKPGNHYINKVPQYERGLRSEFAINALSYDYLGDKTLDGVVLPKIDSCMEKIHQIECQLHEVIEISINVLESVDRIDALEKENRALKDRLATLESIILGTVK